MRMIILTGALHVKESDSTVEVVCSTCYSACVLLVTLLIRGINYMGEQHIHNMRTVVLVCNEII